MITKQKETFRQIHTVQKPGVLEGMRLSIALGWLSTAIEETGAEMEVVAGATATAPSSTSSSSSNSTSSSKEQEMQGQGKNKVCGKCAYDGRKVAFIAQPSSHARGHVHEQYVKNHPKNSRVDLIWKSARRKIHIIIFLISPHFYENYGVLGFLFRCRFPVSPCGSAHVRVRHWGNSAEIRISIVPVDSQEGAVDSKQQTELRFSGSVCSCRQQKGTFRQIHTVQKPGVLEGMRLSTALGWLSTDFYFVVVFRCRPVRVRTSEYDTGVTFIFRYNFLVSPCRSAHLGVRHWETGSADTSGRNSPDRTQNLANSITGESNVAVECGIRL
ncbi:hypothetical protein Taro_006274 [Colocasia esculenta]|uniref:Uncharacterized protein n=1 Tax=Colocasia esculenta TaxID=4460 RepID=A0A843TWV4_COLES|nr:hypothetical protein [Colocasia esculenta]